MEEPTIYNSENELIKWIVSDLNKRRFEFLYSNYNSKFRCLDYYLVPAQLIAINIAPSSSEISHIEINFDFSIKNIINKLSSNADLVYFEALYSNIYIVNVKFNKTVDFSNFDFKTNILFNNVHFCDYVDFSNSIFQNLVSFEYSKIDILINFNSSHFKNKISFSNSKIEEMLMSCVKFNKSCEFYNDIIINSVKIYGLNDNINSLLIFNNIIFDNENSLLSIINCKLKYIDLLNTIIKGMINIEHSSADMVNFKYSIVNGGVINLTNFTIKEFMNRESALFFKNQAYARNNIIDALEYKAKEIEMHKKELIKKPNKTSKDWLDIISIFLSSLYSDNGQNWGKSLLCTLIIPSIFFSISYIPYNISYFLYILILSFLFIEFKCKDILKYICTSIFAYIIFCGFLPIFYLYGLKELLNIDFFKELLRFLTPTNFEAITNISKYNMSYIYKDNHILGIITKSFSYFLGKIAFWYGSVQTIKAFRKFSKNS